MTNLKKAIKLLNSKGDVKYKVIKETPTYVDIETSLFLGNGLNKIISMNKRDVELEVERVAFLIEDEALYDYEG